MTEQARGRKSLGWLVGGATLLGVGIIAFMLFEPVLTYKSGWKALDRGAPQPAQTETLDPAWANSAQAAQAALLRYYQDTEVPAVSAAVAIDGRVVWRGAVGFADLEAGTPIRLDDRFRIGSSSKAVTAVAVGTLLDEGKIDLDAPLKTFEPTLPEPLGKASLRQAMSHRAGVRNYGLCLCFPAMEHQNRRRFDSVRASVRAYENNRLLFEPGAGFAYTSFGFNLTGLAIEHASGETFGAYLKRGVFDPLGMENSALDSINGAPAERVGFYEVEGGRYKRAFRVDNSIRWPSGGVLSTPSDMVRLGSAMLDGGRLSTATRAALLTIPAEGRTGGGDIYALGWRVSAWDLPDDTKLEAYHHNGTAVGSTSVFAVFPSENMVVSVMANKGAEDARELSVAAKAIVMAFKSGS